MIRKSLAQFIAEHRARLDQIIAHKLGSSYRPSDSERKMWILNDEGLYRWARSEGVKI